jgi:glycosyltransferase involved in cell wall biosynthesis
MDSPGAGPTPFVSIVIPARNEAHHIGHCLDGALGQDYPADRLEVLVADGRSDDGTRDVLAGYAARDPRLRVIDNPRRFVSTGLNEAIGVARGDVIVRMDAHTEYAPDYVRACVTALRETGADNVGGPARTRPESYLGRAVAAAYHSPYSTGGARFHDPSYEGPVDTVTYGCWARGAFDRFGRFDEELARNQDDEHNLRIWRAGGAVWQTPRIVSWYKPRSSLPGLFRQYMQYGYWKVRVIQKHRLPASVRHLVPGLFLVAILGLAVAAPFSAVALWMLAGLSTLYALVLLAASVSAGRSAGWDLIPVLPVVFSCYHFGYGYGFLRGMWDFGVRRRSPGAAFTALTRGAQEPGRGVGR